MGFAKQLKRARKQNKNDYTQQDIASMLDIDTSTYSKYETGTREPNVDKLKKIARILDVSVDFLLETGIEKTNVYSIQEKEFLDKFKQLSSSRQNKINKYIDIELEEQEEEYTKKQYLKIARGGQEELVSSKDIDELIEKGEKITSDDDLL